jgi:hypothetical protein
MTARAEIPPNYRKVALLLVIFLLVGLVGVHFGDGSLEGANAGVARSALPQDQQQPRETSWLRGYSPDAALNVARHSSAAKIAKAHRAVDRSSIASDPRSIRRLRRRVASADGWVGLIP